MRKIIFLVLFTSLFSHSLASGKRVLAAGNSMLKAGEIVRGTCSNYVNTVYNRAGYTVRARKTVFKGYKKKGPYASVNIIRPGDWLTYQNGSYSNAQCGIFVRWVNKSKAQATMISYLGENLDVPARIREYHVSQIYNIVRSNDSNNRQSAKKFKTPTLTNQQSAKKFKAPRLSDQQSAKKFEAPILADQQSTKKYKAPKFTNQQSAKKLKAPTLNIRRFNAEKSATVAGRRVLSTGRKMFNSNIVVPGTAEGYANAILKRAGYGHTQQKTIFESKKRGKYASTFSIMSGDLVCFINHSYKQVKHCGIFVRWINKRTRKAEILSYAGENRRESGRYRNYLLSSVYKIIRPSALSTSENIKKQVYATKYMPRRNARTTLPKQSRTPLPRQSRAPLPSQSRTTLPRQSRTPIAGNSRTPLPSQRVLNVAFQMLNAKKIVVGSSVDYIKAIFLRAGYPSSKRYTILRGTKKAGPYASSGQIKSGDWLCFINHSYKGVAHCGIFVRWANQRALIGEILSYAGENRKVAARLKNYKLAHVYQIVRAK